MGGVREGWEGLERGGRGLERCTEGHTCTCT